MEKWQWKGSDLELVEFVQWTLMLVQFSRDKPEEWMDVIRDVEKMSQKAIEYGMTHHVIAREMIRAATEFESKFQEEK